MGRIEHRFPTLSSSAVGGAPAAANWGMDRQSKHGVAKAPLTGDRLRDPGNVA
jgi:hypothetical protein